MPPPGSNKVSQEAAASDLLSLGAALHIVQALTAAPAISSESLCLITRGAQFVEDVEPADALSPRAAGLWGLASVIALEHPDLYVRALDLDRDDGAKGGAALLWEILNGKSPRVALRGARRWRPQLRRYGVAGAVPLKEGRPLRVEVARSGTIDGVELVPFASAALAMMRLGFRY